MQMPKTLSHVAIGLLAYFGIGCSAASNPAAPLPKLTRDGVMVIANEGPALQTAAERMANQIPGFGGMFVSNGALNVYLTDMAQQNSASQAITAEQAQHGRSELAVRLVQGEFRYADLEKWRRSLLPVLGIQGIVFSETDERANRVRIGVRDQSAQATIEETLLRLNAPREAFIVALVPAPVLYTTLQDKFRPLRGGFQITGFWSQDGANQSAICTHGPNVTYQDAKYMVVNSHCTQNGSVGGLIGADMYQAWVGTGNFFGTEVSDPPYTSTTFGCPAGGLCRYSDAALVQDASNASWEIAAIARPLGPPTLLPAIYGSLTIDAANPKFTLTNVLQDLFVGDTLHKVGRTTGWTTGVVVSTCRDITIGGYTRLCSGVVSAGAGHGDSGSPVFFQAGTGAYLLTGLLFGGLVGPDGVAGSEYDFSNWRWVNYELGITGSLDPITPPTPTCSPPSPC
jgi:hypothetical protein